MARRKAAPKTTEADVVVPDMNAEQSQQISDRTREAYVQADTAVSATESSTPQADLTAEQLYIGKLAAQLIAPNHHNMAPEHIEARCKEALDKAEVLLATLKARYSK